MRPRLLGGIGTLVLGLSIALGANAQTQPMAGSRAAAASKPPGRFIRLADGRRLYLSCMGQGSPTVLFESGFGAGSDAWVRVQPKVALTHRACAYDRAGYGLSDPGPRPRDGAAIAADLDQALRAAHIGGPFILVGHSAGALYMRLFAERRRDVAGMVLVDPSVEHQDRQMADFGGADLTSLRARARRCLTAPGADDASRMICGTQLAELDGLWGPTSAEIDAGRQGYGRLPLVVLTAGGSQDGGFPSPAAQRWTQLHVALAARSEIGVQRVIPGSSHLMMKDRPDAIVEAVAEVAAGSKSPPGR